GRFLRTGRRRSGPQADPYGARFPLEKLSLIAKKLMALARRVKGNRRRRKDVAIELSAPAADTVERHKSSAEPRDNGKHHSDRHHRRTPVAPPSRANDRS